MKFGQVLYELARDLLPGHPAPLITEVPNQVLAVVYPDRQLKCQFANRRVDIADARGSEPGTDPFVQVAMNAIGAARQAGGAQIPVVAYGYNYDVQLTLRMDSGDFLRSRFFSNPEALGSAFNGTVEAVGIKVSVKTADCQANFDIEPILGQAKSVKAHVNYHFEGKAPPQEAEALAEQVMEKYRHFRQALERL